MNKRLIASAATAAVLIAAAGTAFAASGSSGTASDYTAVAPYRLANHTPVTASTQLSLPLIGADSAAGGVPADVTAVTVDIVVVNPTLGGYLVAWPGAEHFPRKQRCVVQQLQHQRSHYHQSGSAGAVPEPVTV